MEPLPEVTHEELDAILAANQIKEADELLVKWYRITQGDRGVRWFPRVAPYCRQSKSSRQYQDASDLSWDSISKIVYEKVTLAVEKLELDDYAAIQQEMKNRQIGRQVWKYKTASTYQQALVHVSKFMDDYGVFD